MKKMALILGFTIFLMGSFFTPAFGATQGVTVGISWPMLEGEYELKILENGALCIRKGCFIPLGVIYGTGVGYRWYYNSEVMDGFYCGGYVDYLQARGLPPFWESPGPDSMITFQGVWGYKKVVGKCFAFDLGVTATVADFEEYGILWYPGFIAKMGVAW